MKTNSTQLSFFLLVYVLVLLLSFAHSFNSTVLVNNKALSSSHYEIIDGSLYQIDNHSYLLNHKVLKQSMKMSLSRVATNNQRQKKVWDFISTFDSYKTSSSYKNDENGKPTLENFRYIILPIWWSDYDTNDPSRTMSPVTVILPFEENQPYYIDMSWGKMTNGVTWKLLSQELFDISSIFPNFDDTDSSARNILALKGFTKGADYDGICLTYYTAQSGPFSGAGGWGSVNGE